MDKKSKERVNKLTDLGLIFNGEEFTKEDINVHWSEIACETDQKFEKIVTDIRAVIAHRKNTLECKHCGEQTIALDKFGYGPCCDLVECVGCMSTARRGHVENLMEADCYRCENCSSLVGRPLSHG